MTVEQPVIHVVDDDRSFLTAVSRLLRAAGFKVRTYPSARKFLEREQPGGPGCLLADLRMPGQSGLDLQVALAREPDPLPVVFLTGHGDIPSSVRAMKRGAEDFLTKRASREELLAAVDRALKRNASERAERLRLRELKERLQALTAREREVLLHVVSGKLNKQIAADLGIHERTVKLHRTAITRKLNVPSVAQLTRLAHEGGLLP
jgi:two-component system response regulator FixJ